LFDIFVKQLLLRWSNKYLLFI